MTRQRSRSLKDQYADPSALQTVGQLERVGACPACGSPQREYVFHSREWLYGLPGEFAMMRCSRCRSLYPDPRPTSDSLGSYYPAGEYYSYSEASRYALFARSEPLARLWYSASRGILRGRHGYEELGGSTWLGAVVAAAPRLRARATFRLGVLLHPWRPGGALLDVGCGAGTYLDLMRALGWARVVGVDVSAAGVERARTKLGLEAYVGQLADVHFPADTFDAVTLSHTLEHVADPVALLREARRILKPGGRIAIVVPNAHSMLSRLLGRYWLGLDPPRHLINFSPLGLHTTLVRAGLSIESLEAPARGAYRVALFSTSRRFGDPRAVFADATHSFGLRRRTLSAALALAEHSACAAGARYGETLCAVAYT